MRFKTKITLLKNTKLRNTEIQEQDSAIHWMTSEIPLWTFEEGATLKLFASLLACRFGLGIVRDSVEENNSGFTLGGIPK